MIDKSARFLKSEIYFPKKKQNIFQVTLNTKNHVRISNKYSLKSIQENDK